MFKISYKIRIEKSADLVWDLISSPGHLNQFHPFCKENKVLESKNAAILKDQLIYLNDELMLIYLTQKDPCTQIFLLLQYLN